MKTQRNKSTKYNILIVILLLCIVAGVFNGVIFLSRGDDLTEHVNTYTFYSAEEFVAYSLAYAQGYRNPEDVLNISITSGSTITNDQFVSLGTADRPFAGTINISTAGIDTFRLSNCPLFDYVTTDMKLTGAGTVKIIREKAAETPAVGVLTSGALFANHVVLGELDENGDPIIEEANWSVSLLPYSGDGDAATSFEGLIGDIADDATVTVTFTNTSSIPDVSGSGNIGLICGTLGENATLNVTTAGSSSDIKVTSTGGNAGSLVGEMGSGSTLKLNSENNSGVNSVTSSSGYAGGIVGYADNVTIEYADGVTDYAVSGSVEGKEGAGGLFGYYKNTDSPITFTLEDTYFITSGMNMSSTNNAGGVFGVLENNGASFTFDGNASGSETFDINLSGGTNRGGICGKYITNALTNTLTFTNTSATIRSASSATNGGGLIGLVSESPAYITTTGNVSINVGSGSITGGLFGALGKAGSFADVKGNITISGNVGSGIVGTLNSGVLRMQGTTNLSGATISNGQFVGTRGRSLVYALGDGEGLTGVHGNWKVLRKTSNKVDDIGTWGEVIRTDGTILAESDLFTVDSTAHTVTVKAPVTTMNTVTDFAKTALNIKLNTADGVGALQFASATRSATLLSGTLTLGADINLSGTGILGLTRDDGENDAFSGTFNGGSHSITLAIGEQYGLNGSGAALTTTDEQGTIYKHRYNGLFAETNNATVQNLTVTGASIIHQKTGAMDNNTPKYMFMGGISAYATGSLTLTSNAVNFTQDLIVDGDYELHFGGAVGEASGSGLAISVSGGSYKPTFNDKTASGTAAGSYYTYAGGVIGVVNGDAAGANMVSMSGSTVGIDYDKPSNANRASCFGGVIAKIANAAYSKDSRKVSLTNVTVDVDVDNGRTDATGKKFGGILGTEWYAADVTLDGVTLNADIESVATTAVGYGGLVQTATGYWNIADIAVADDGDVNFNLPSNGSTFGFVANKTYVSETGKNGALYLEVDNTSSHYDIADVTFTDTPTFSAFDEIVASSRFDDTNITNNGNSIISITTEGNIINTSGTANTYQNQTELGKLAANAVNPNTRYYYNIAHARTARADDEAVDKSKCNFLVWTVKQYAHSSLSAWFTASNTFTGDLDMTGLSYYPIDLTTGVTFSNVSSLKLDNNLMETWVHTAYSGNTTRTTRSNTNQHYLMHTAIFRNVTANITISGTGAVLQGNVPKLSDSFCGFLIAGTLGGSDTVNVKFNASNLTFDGVYVSNAGANFTNNSYAPLFINKVGKNTTLTISGAKQSTMGYSSYASNGYYAGSSLIGNVGDTTARTIYLTFMGLKFDGRSSASSIGNMDTAYGTTKAIFSRATILNSFLYAGESSGSYNYELSEDWTNSTTAIHEVTYGKEITSSSEFSGQEKKYINQTDYYTHPTSGNSTSEYDFSTGFLPYVYTTYNLEQYKHEISVNVSFSATIAGCGKYDDPYIIDSSDNKLYLISKIINGQNVGTDVTIYIPSDYTSVNYTDTGYTKDQYAYDTSNGGDNDYNKNARKYFAGAYYVITQDVTLPYNYIGLGTASGAEYAFRGVIIGRGNPTITITSRDPLILNSLGSVIKDITVNIDIDESNYSGSHTIPLAAPEGNGAYAYSGGNQTYGAVIKQVLGGDTIIDNVQVTFTDAVFNITTASGTYQRLVPIGGYIGTLVNGGVIFRNMAAAEGKNYAGLTKSYLADSHLQVGGAVQTVNDDTYNGYLYINPIIGRVIAGYAFYEKTTGNIDDNTVTVVNGNKNYTISDLVLPNNSSQKLGVTSGYAVTIPNGQSIYILGAIVNSGAGAASAYDGDYDGIADFWQAYRANTVTRGLATYNFVGDTSNAGYSADLAKAQNDSHTAGLSGTPYIIRAYTYDPTPSENFHARAVARNNCAITVTHDCDVPAGFRGIGSIYYNSDSTQLTINSMTGQKTSTSSYQIKLNMRYLEYNHNYLITSTSPYTASPYIAYADNTGSLAGFGLFNKLNINDASESNCVQYLELAGSIYYDVYKMNGTQAEYKYANYQSGGSNADRTDYAATLGSGDETNARTILSVGGIAGVVNSQFYLRNVTFNNLAVEGAKSAGGLIGFVFINDTANNISTIDYTDGITNAGYVNVIGGQCAGGLIGRIYRAAVEIKGASGGTNIIIKDIKSKNTVPDETGMFYFANVTTGVGGLVGNCWGTDRLFTVSGKPKGTADSGEKPSSIGGGGVSVKRLHISDMNVVKGTSAATISVQNDSDSYNNYAGGFVGSAHDVWLKITNSNVIGVNVTANAAGGFIGKVTQKYYLEIIGCTADGNSKSTSITGTRFAGGATGWVIGRDTLYFQLLDSTVKDYLIESQTTGENIAGAGGMVGYAEGNNKSLKENSNYICQFNNLAVLNCDIKTNYTNKTNNNLKYKNGTGGIIGVIDTINVSDGQLPDELVLGRTGANKYKFSGYNILVKDCTLTHLDGGDTEKNYSIATGANKNRRIGDLVGNNAIETPIKWVGVSVENTGAYNSTTGKNDYCGKHVGYYNDDNDHYGTDPTKDSDYTAPYKRYGPGYVVFANYNASDSGTTLANIDDSTTPADDCTNVPAAYPYNTVNPTLDIGGVMLTGDGVAANKDVLAIKNILLDGVAGRYKYAASALYETGVTNYAAFNANAGKLVMFRSEVPTYLGTDFPVLIVDSTDHATTHKLINSYLRLLTNTTHDFGRDSAGEYEVEIYNMSFDNGVFVPSATGASLKRKDNQFYMSATTFDSGKTQFSLIDVRFFDPANPTQVAYHLYVPVFVKKVMTYQFDIAVLSGTDYLKSTYTSHFGDPLIENTGTPVTFFFRYTYSKTNEDSSSSPVRTTTEWQDAINAGENVNRNYEKKLQFYKANTNDVLNDMPGDTILVLVDPNRGGKPYYAKLSDALSGNTINLSAFKETMTKSGDTVTFSGDSFAPVNLDQMMNISLAMNGDDPITYVGAARDGENHLYRLATAEEIADGNITKYTISGTVASAYTSGDHYVECDSALVECADNDATVMVGSQGYRPVTDAEILNSGITKYSVVVTDSPLVEQYYLSVFTESNAVNDELFHYYLVQSPSAFDETEYPSRISDTGAHTMVHLVMGKIFYHGNFSISSTSGDGALIMSDTNTTLTVTMNATMGLNKSLGEAIFENMQALVDATNVYQGFLLYLNREESPNSYKAILGSPTGSGTYQIDSGVATDYAGNIDVNQNFAKFTTGDLSSNFAAGNFETGNNFTISAEVTLTYSAGAIPTQFPSKANNENNGTWVSGASNIAFSTDAVANSKNRIGGDEGVSKKLYYSEGEPDVASLDLNPVGDRVGDFTPLGINARNNDGQQSATIDLLAVLDVTSIQDQIRDNPSTPSDDESYTNAVVTVTLLQKQNDASYTGIDDISQYITGLELVDSSIIVTDAGASYTATIPKTNPKLSDNGAEITLPVLRFTIKTGSAFESGDLTYGNYRINVSVRLQKSDEPITNSEATNYVIYSNVKVIPYYID